ncbi:cytochrome c [Neobacillus sp. MM2021_6]|uniref:cytochrome c551 n=1 Tax=Bacillaceae TaxID=186817 RepID=UPI00140BC660|nr:MULTISPECIES: cytochrome c [Bacillaceae]MBO0959073.1 cytochrome c [Neobacillus sp. MM2021_6]NHC21401.1 cytochrome c [Bacillus sp. MM2020_4]
MKKKLLTLLLGTSLVMGLAACGGGDDDTSKDKDNGGTDTTETASAGDAQKIYDQKCSSCHGGDLKGAMGPDLTKVGSRYSKDEILDILKNGKSGGMPANVVTGDDADKVADWLAAKK